jgi:hypothetical protein
VADFALWLCLTRRAFITLAANTGPAAEWKFILDTSTWYAEMSFSAKHDWLMAVLGASAGKVISFQKYDYCVKCFSNLIGIHFSTLYRAKTDAARNVRSLHGNNGSCKPREKTLEARAWLRAHAARCGDFLPHKKAIQLPEFCMEQLYLNYVHFFHHDCRDADGVAPDVVSRKTFSTSVAKHGLVYTMRKFFKSCDVCDVLKASQRSAPTEAEKLQFAEQLRGHNVLQTDERDQYSLHKNKARTHPAVYISVAMDEIDKDKSGIPIVNSKTGDQQKLPSWGIHATGVIVHGPKGFTKVYTWYDEFPHEANVTMECLLRTLEDFQDRNGFLPPKLYVQFDNAKNNKCNAMLRLLALMVELGLFQKIKLCFLLVGHTHNDVNQFFSLFTRICGSFGWEIYTLPGLHEFIGSLLGGNVVVEHLDQVLDYTAWLQTLNKSKVKGVSKPGLFRFRQFEDQRSGKTLTLMHTRKLMALTRKLDAACYQPESGVHLFPSESITSLPLEVQAVPRKPLDTEHAKSRTSVESFPDVCQNVLVRIFLTKLACLSAHFHVAYFVLESLCVLPQCKRRTTTR